MFKIIVAPILDTDTVHQTPTVVNFTQKQLGDFSVDEFVNKITHLVTDTKTSNYELCVYDDSQSTARPLLSMGQLVGPTVYLAWKPTPRAQTNMIVDFDFIGMLKRTLGDITSVFHDAQNGPIYRDNVMSDFRVLICGMSVELKITRQSDCIMIETVDMMCVDRKTPIMPKMERLVKRLTANLKSVGIVELDTFDGEVVYKYIIPFTAISPAQLACVLRLFTKVLSKVYKRLLSTLVGGHLLLEKADIASDEAESDQDNDSEQESDDENKNGCEKIGVDAEEDPASSELLDVWYPLVSGGTPVRFNGVERGDIPHVGERDNVLWVPSACGTYAVKHDKTKTLFGPLQLFPAQTFLENYENEFIEFNITQDVMRRFNMQHGDVVGIGNQLAIIVGEHNGNCYARLNGRRGAVCIQGLSYPVTYTKESRVKKIGKTIIVEVERQPDLGLEDILACLTQLCETADGANLLQQRAR